MADHDIADSAPLIQDDGASSRRSFDHASPPQAPRLTFFVWALTFAAGISGLLFGYEYESPSHLAEQGSHR